MAHPVSVEHQRLGELVRAHRSVKGLSQEQLADLAGLNRAYVGGVERGERNIALANLLRLAEALDIPLSHLVADIDEVGREQARQRRFG